MPFWPRSMPWPAPRFQVQQSQNTGTLFRHQLSFSASFNLPTKISSPFSVSGAPHPGQKCREKRPLFPQKINCPSKLLPSLQWWQRCFRIFLANSSALIIFQYLLHDFLCSLVPALPADGAEGGDGGFIFHYSLLSAHRKICGSAYQGTLHPSQSPLPFFNISLSMRGFPFVGIACVSDKNIHNKRKTIMLYFTVFVDIKVFHTPALEFSPK